MITIDNVASKRKLSALNFDKMTDRYIADSRSIIIPSPNIWTIQKNFYFLLRHSEKKQFDKKYVMKPSYLSYDEYGTVILSNLLMYINSVSSIEDFNLDQVIIPDLNAIVYITRDNYPEKKTKDLLKVKW